MSDMEMGVEMDVFSTCRKCGVPVSREIDMVTPAMDSWVDITGGDGCSGGPNHSDDGVHEALTMPQDGTPLVFVQEHQINNAVRIRVGRRATFLYPNPDESGEWYVCVQGENGTLSRVVSVHPNTVEVAE